MGPSGSGKTTLLGILGLLFTPSQGGVLLDGAPVSHRRRTALRASAFAWVFQGANVVSHRSALDNAALGLLARGARVREAEEAARAALDAVGIGQLAGKAANTLSGGELQRVCVARAIAARPRFILADEPTGQLDHANTEGVIQALIGNRPDGAAVVIATHDPEVAAHCDRIVRLRDGVVVKSGG
jgi:ABC-type lipoprotein export system ATPase subunit